MRHYETTYILRPNLGEDQFNEVIERTNTIITDDGGSIINLDRWGMKRLAYEIKKETQGYYVHVNYAAPGTTIDEMERIFRIDDRLLRFLTIKLNDSIDQESIDKEKEHIAAQTSTAETADAEVESAEAKKETADAEVESEKAEEETAGAEEISAEAEKKTADAEAISAEAEEETTEEAGTLKQE